MAAPLIALRCFVFISFSLPEYLPLRSFLPAQDFPLGLCSDDAITFGIQSGHQRMSANYLSPSVVTGRRTGRYVWNSP